MRAYERRLAAGLILLSAVLVSRGSPAMSGDAPYYLAVAHSIVHDADLDLRNQFDPAGTYPFTKELRRSYAREDRAGRLLPSQGLGFSLALAPVYGAAGSVVGAVPESWLARVRWNRQRAVRDLVSLALAAFAAWLAVLTWRTIRRSNDDEAAGSGWIVLLAFVSAPLVLASLQAVPEMAAAGLILWFWREQASPAGRPGRAGLALALLPWMHMRFALVALAGALWLARTRPRAAALPFASLALFPIVTFVMFGSIWPPAYPDIQALSAWRWLVGLPAPLFSLDTGLLWVAPFWLVGLAGVAGRRRSQPGSARIAALVLAGLILLADVFENGLTSQAPGMALAPALPLLAPFVADGFRAVASGWQRTLARTLAAYSVLLAVLVAAEPRRLLAEPGGAIGRLPQHTIAWIKGINSPSARLRRLGIEPDDAAFKAAARDGRPDVVDLFLSAGFSPDTALREAVEAGQAGVLARLVAHPVNGLEGARALARAAELGRKDLVDLFASASITIDSPDQHGETALMSAVYGRRADERRLLLRLGANVNAVSRTRQTALMMAVTTGDVSALRELVAGGADVNLADLDGWTPLHLAARLGRWDDARILVLSGANVNARSRIGWTPLMWAAYGGSTQIARALLEAGADPDAQSPAGQTPLIRAAGQGHLEVVEALLSAGARPDTTVDGVDAAAWAARNGHSAVAERLLRARRQP